MRFQTTTPAAITRPILKLCKEVAGDAEARFIPVRTGSQPAALSAFDAVALKVEQEGGILQPGWAVWQFADALIEAEFIAVWRSPEGELVDVAARPGGEQTILFVEDARRGAGGADVDSERRALRRDPLIEDFITLGRKQFLLLHADPSRDAGDAADAPALMRRMAVSQLIVKNMLEKGQSGDDPCLCNSGKRYKNCHGKAVRSLRV
ncbi:MAG: SEC-C domain-containing protein [Noviherbaspirillum sp.]